MCNKPHIIIELGSSYVKAGFAGETAPRTVFPTVIGRAKVPGMLVGDGIKDYVIGSAAKEQRGTLIVTHPIEMGIVGDWEDIENILNHIFLNELCVDPQEHHILITEPPFNPNVNREKITQIMFDSFNVLGFYTAKTASCALRSINKLTGLVVESGGMVTHITPVFDGYVLPFSTLRCNLGGQEVSTYLSKILSHRGIHLTSSDEREVVNDLKEQKCYVAQKADQVQQEQLVQYEKPNGEVITVGNELFLAPEVLFKPALLGKEYDGIPSQIFQSISKTNTTLWAELYQNIVLSGGNTLFAGLAERLEKEVKLLAPQYLRDQVTVHATSEHKYSTWIGASQLASLEYFKTSWITQEEYQEAGPSIVHHKCF